VTPKKMVKKRYSGLVRICLTVSSNVVLSLSSPLTYRPELIPAEDEQQKTHPPRYLCAGGHRFLPEVRRLKPESEIARERKRESVCVVERGGGARHLIAEGLHVRGLGGLSEAVPQLLRLVLREEEVGGGQLRG
jgi:hypothetical protein